MTFQQVSEIAPGQPGVTDLVAVMMSPQHFKGFIRAATEVLTAYEASFGQLSMSDEDTRPTRTAADMERQVQIAREALARLIPSSTEPPPPSKQSRVSSPRKEKKL
jgi:hypothetical protein